MNQAKTVILVFDSVHDVIRAEKALKKTGIWCDLVPTPREISSDCGMSVECRADDLPRLQSLQEQGLLCWEEMHTQLSA
jgi:hypothetical protein